MVAKDAVTPVQEGASDLVKSWMGPDGRAVKIVVKAPTPAIEKSVNLGPVPAGADARPYFEQAVTLLKSAGASTLVVPTGVYTFSSLATGGQAHWLMTGLKDVTIDGQGSTLIFTQDKNGIQLVSATRVRIRNFKLKYSMRTSSLGEVVVDEAGVKYIKVDPRYPVTAADQAYQFAEYDTAKNLWIPNGKRVILPPGSTNPAVLDVANQRYRTTAFDNLAVGKKFTIQHHWYGGIALTVADQRLVNPSEDVIIDGITVSSSPGMGVVGYGLKRGFAVINSSFVTDPDGKNIMSNEYDAIHIQLVAGDVILQNNMISRQGDDAVNVNSPVTPVRAISADGLTLRLETYSRFIAQGDQLAFFDPNGQMLGTATATAHAKYVSGLQYDVTLDRAIEGLTTSSLARDLALTTTRVSVSQNTVKDCHCHGILMQVPNSIIEDNTIENTMANAVRLLTNTGTFKEGVGAVNSIVRNNVIRNSGYDSAISIPWGAIGVYGAINGGVTPNPVNRNIAITGNRITGSNQGCIMVISSANVRVSDNICETANLLNAGKPSLHIEKAKGVTILGNTRIGASTGPLNIDSNSVSEVTGQSSY
jgi:hypothetical protein